MALSTVVTIFEVGDDGATGPRVGTGVLLAPDLVAVHEPLSTRLAGGTGKDRLALRVGLAPSDGVVEVLDVAAPHVSRGADRALALELRGGTTAHIQHLPTGLEEFRSALRHLLDTTSGEPSPDLRADRAGHGGVPRPPGHPRPPGFPRPPGHGSDTERPPWCRIWPRGPGC